MKLLTLHIVDSVMLNSSVDKRTLFISVTCSDPQQCWRCLLAVRGAVAHEVIVDVGAQYVLQQTMSTIYLYYSQTGGGNKIGNHTTNHGLWR